MKNIFLFPFLLFLLAGCSTGPGAHQQEPVRFDYVDFTLFHQFRTTSVHIDSARQLVVCTYWGRNRKEFYKGRLSAGLDDKLDSLLRIIFTAQRDTFVGEPHPDGTAYRIVFKNKGKNITVTNWGDTCCGAADQIVFPVTDLVKEFKIRFADTNFIFPSRSIIPKRLDSPE